jgi:hypothetical protein
MPGKFTCATLVMTAFFSLVVRGDDQPPTDPNKHTGAGVTLSLPSRSGQNNPQDGVADDGSRNQFLVGQVNDTATIRVVKEIAHQPIADLENRMRPGKLRGLPPIDFNRSSEGFLGKDESLLSVLAEDNDLVRNKYKNTHQQMAKPLIDFLAAYRSEENEKVNGYVFLTYPKNSLHPQRYKIRVVGTKGFQPSPFMDGTSSGSLMEIENLDNGAKVNTAVLVFELIKRYGFYEGKGTPYRLKPEDLVAAFPFLDRSKAGFTK